MSGARSAGFPTYRGASAPRLGSRLARLAPLLAAAVWLALPGTSSAAPPRLDTGFADGLYTSSNPLTRDQWLDETVNARSEFVRINVVWRGVVSGEPANPRNSNDAAYDFSSVDAAVADAQARNLEVLLTFYSAPNYAEGGDPPGNAPAGTWKPKPGAVEDFAFAFASRYPQVDYIQAWNEPDLSGYLNPQYKGRKARSPGVYKDLLNAAFKGVHDAGDAKLVTAGTAPYGDPPGGDRMHPLVFWRKVFCLRGRKQLKPRNCGKKPKLDVFAHHPINTSGGPHLSAAHPDDASTPDFKNVVRILRKAERVNNVAGNHHPAWATELWWESDPPDEVQGVPKGKHARWLEDALYVLWKQGARVVINLQIRDADFDQDPFGRNTTGIFFHSDNKKPAFRAWRFPFVTHRRSQKRIGAWGKAPAAGTLVIERRKDGDWRKLGQASVELGEVFTESLKLPGAGKLRARVGGEKSLVWKQGG